jgi:hypothetical protein
MCSPDLHYFVSCFDRYFIQMEALLIRNSLQNKIIRSKNVAVREQFGWNFVIRMG